MYYCRASEMRRRCALQTEQIAFLIALLVAIVLPNTAILLSIVKSSVGRKSRMKFFIMHLAIAGLKFLPIALARNVIKSVVSVHLFPL